MHCARTAANSNACALDFGDPNQNINMPNGTNDVAIVYLYPLYCTVSAATRY